MEETKVEQTKTVVKEIVHAPIDAAKVVAKDAGIVGHDVVKGSKEVVSGVADGTKTVASDIADAGKQMGHGIRDAVPPMHQPVKRPGEPEIVAAPV